MPSALDDILRSIPQISQAVMPAGPASVGPHGLFQLPPPNIAGPVSAIEQFVARRQKESMIEAEMGLKRKESERQKMRDWMQFGPQLMSMSRAGNVEAARFLQQISGVAPQAASPVSSPPSVEARAPGMSSALSQVANEFMALGTTPSEAFRAAAHDERVQQAGVKIRAEIAGAEAGARVRGAERARREMFGSPDARLRRQMGIRDEYDQKRFERWYRERGMPPMQALDTIQKARQLMEAQDIPSENLDQVFEFIKATAERMNKTVGRGQLRAAPEGDEMDRFNRNLGASLGF